MKKKIAQMAFAVAGLSLLSGCIGNFEAYNTNPYDAYQLNPPLLFPTMITTGINVQQNDNQMVDQMVGGSYGGYLSMSQSWGKITNFNTYSVDDGWNQVPFNTAYNKFYPNYFQLLRATEGKGHYFAFAQLLRVNTMHRITDCYGPIPYSQVAEGVTTVPYDSQEEVYKHMFEDLEDAIANLKGFVTEANGLKPLEGYDPVYNGDYTKWIRFANSLKLRLALRISVVSPVLAQKMAEEAVNDGGGLIDSPEFNAVVEVGAEPNPLWLVGSGWGEIRINASLASYMNGYEDARRGVYFKPSKIAGADTYLGLRSGIKGAQPATYTNFSMPNYEQKSSLVMFYCSETAFLRAEGALRGWNMKGTAKELYETGIRLSFAERGVSGADDYLSNAELTPAPYVSPVESAKQNYTPKTKITIAWNEAAGQAEKLERIITQKWIANYPLGFEGWADFRRTGYPELFPVVDNLSNGVISTERQQRRLTFPLTEKQANGANVNVAISLLGGPDTGATDLWWAKKN